MSFLNDVLSSAEEADLDTGRRNIPIISERILACKEEINKYIEDVYHKFSEWPRKNQQLLDTTARLSADIQDLQSRMEQIAVKDVACKVGELSSLSIELERSNIALGIVIRLSQIQELLLEVQDLQKKKCYVKAGLELRKADELIMSIPEDEGTVGVPALKLSVLTEKNLLVKKLTDLFEEDVRLSQRKSENVQTNCVKIRKKGEAADCLSLLVAFHEVDAPLKKLCKFLCGHVCKPIVTGITTVKIDSEGGCHVLTVAAKKASNRIPYKDVFGKLIEVFSFLYDHFNYPINDELSTMAYIGRTIKNDLSEMILNDCLIDTLPTSDEKCNLYKPVIDDTKVFQAKLVKLEIFDADTNPVLNYANDMDLIFINKKCHEYLSTAICYMKKDLHDLVDVGVKHDAGNPLKAGEFPESSVSRSTIEILELGQKVLQQALCENERSAKRMICSVQSIFYQYGNIAHGHHEKLLLTIPQQVALFRNNCMYIAHELSELNEVYSTKFPRAVLPSGTLFTDQAHQLRTMGGEIFLAYVETQIEQIDTLLKENKFTKSYISGSLSSDTDKCLRQCIRQHELLKTVWLKVLPHSFYNKTLGYLLNAFCKKLVDTVVAAEDIPSKNAERLVEMYKVVLARGPKLFPDPQEISLYVETWQKLQDLVFVLGASLNDISDRWAEGKGPLTLHFTAENVRKLIKALFQNTDRRAAVLNKIHN